MLQNTLLGDLISIRSGKSRLKEPGTFPIYGGNGIFGSSVRPNVIEPAVIIGRVGAYCGSVYLEKRPFWLSDNALGITVKEGADLVFVYYLLKILNLNNHSIGGAQPLLTQGILNNIKVSIPGIDKQKKIADILSSLDEKIELNRKMNETLEQMARELFRHYFIDNPEAEKWLIRKIANVVLTNRRGFSPLYAKSGIPVINQRCVRNGTIAEESIQFHNNTLKKAPDWAYLKPWDILVNSMGVGTLGRISQVFMPEKEYLVHSCITILRTDPKIIEPVILGYYIKYLEPNITQMGSGTTGQTSLNNKLFGEISIIIPDMPTQERLAPVLKSLMEQMNKNYSQINTLKTLRDVLLPRLISGKIKV